VDLELELARAQGVPVFYVDLVGKESVPLWDFRYTEELIVRGYEITQQAISNDHGQTLPFRASS
jgi:hypothetical protein